MNEEFLHYLWRFKKIKGSLSSDTGELLEIIHPGYYNTDAGPDFLQARVYIGGLLWAGNVEIHVNASDWNRHKHQHDSAYQNIILHVVYNNDVEINRDSKGKIPTLVLKDKIDMSLFESYKTFITGKSFIPCEQQVANIDKAIRGFYLERMAIERLEMKYHEIIHQWKVNKQSWEETFYQFLLAGFGLKNNYDAFFMLAKNTPLLMLAKHKSNLFQLEALLFGQAGMLNGYFVGKYPNMLKKEYLFLKNKYKLTSVDTKLLKYLRLRPSSFPTIRLSLFASLIYKSSRLFMTMMECSDVESLYNKIEVECSEYWQSHYIWDKASSETSRSFGNKAKELVFINVVLPFMFAFGKQTDNQYMLEKALTFLSKLPAEDNEQIRNWNNIKIKCNSAMESQALLHLKKYYCDNKRCLYCNIGITLLKSVNNV